MLFLLSKPIVRGAGATAFAATVCVTAAVLAADAARVAAAQGRLEAEYTASVAGIPIGRGNWVIDISEDQFTPAASGATTGILGALTVLAMTAPATRPGRPHPLWPGLLLSTMPLALAPASPALPAVLVVSALAAIVLLHAGLVLRERVALPSSTR